MQELRSSKHWRPPARRLRSIGCEIRRRTGMVGPFPDGTSAINLAAARLRYIVGTRPGRPNEVRKILDTTFP
jgi:hypothetical protein